MNLQAIVSPADEILRGAGALLGAVHDLTAAWIWCIISKLAATGLVTLLTSVPLTRAASASASRCALPIAGGASPPPRRLPAGLKSGCELRASAPVPSSSAGKP